MTDRGLLPTVLVLVLVACSDPARPPEGDTGRYIGVIQYSSQPQGVVLAPESVQVGVLFEVIVNSFGSSTCTLPDGVEMSQDGNVATITPYDRSTEETPCSGDMAPRPHAVMLQFNALGMA